MSVVQVYCLFSTVLFFFFMIVLSSSNTIGLMLKALSGIAFLIGAFSTLAVFGVVLANGIRLV